MTNKVSGTLPIVPVTANQTRQRKSAASSVKKSHVEHEKVDRVAQILAEIEEAGVDDSASLQHQLIIKTVTKLLGEKATASTEFKSLITKIDSALSSDSVSQAQVVRLLERLQKAGKS